MAAYTFTAGRDVAPEEPKGVLAAELGAQLAATLAGALGPEREARLAGELAALLRAHMGKTLVCAWTMDGPRVTEADMRRQLRKIARHDEAADERSRAELERATAELMARALDEAEGQETGAGGAQGADAAAAR